MFYILNTFTCHTYEVSWTKEIEQQRQAYRWEEGTVSSAVISKGVNALSNRYSALEEKISMNTKAITNICEELKGVEIKVSKKKKRRRRKCQKKRRSSLVPGYREKMMQEDTVRNGTFSYMASETRNVDVWTVSFWTLLLLLLRKEFQGSCNKTSIYEPGLKFTCLE